MKGKLTYDSLPPPPSLMVRRSGTFTMEINMPPFRAAQIAQEFFGRDPIPHLVGHDPQRLLPAPDIYRTMADLIYRDMREGGYLADLFKPSDYRLDEIIDFSPRWGDESSPAEDLKRGIDFTRLYPERRVEHKVAVIHVGTDFSTLEARVLATLADKRVRGIILDLEGHSGEIYRPRDIFAAPYGPPIVAKKPAVKQNGRSASYLDMDPTKRHKGRGRRR